MINRAFLSIPWGRLCTAITLTVGLAAWTPPARAGSANERLDIWLNQSLAWGSTANPSNSKYTEERVVPLRFVATLGAGTTHTVALKYDFSSGTSRYFIDSLTGFAVTESGVDPLRGLTSLGSPTTWAFPADSTLRSSAQRPGNLIAYNVTSLSFSGYGLSTGVKSLSVTFTVPGLKGDPDKTVVLVYGANLASERVWGPNSGASRWPGASGKAYASLDGKSAVNAAINPSATTVVPSADLSVSKSVLPEIKVGEDFSYAIQVRNAGPNTASAVTVTDALPAETTFVSGTPAPSGLAPLTFSLGDLASGATATITINVNLKSGGRSILNTASVSSTTLDPNTANNAASATTYARDRTPPVFTVVPPAVVVGNDPGLASAVVSFTVTASDESGAVTVVSTPASGSAFPLGTTTVTSTATDTSGNKATATFTVTVNDVEAPTLTCPTDITVDVAANSCGKAVTFPEPVVTDNSLGPVAVVFDPPSGTPFAIGKTTVRVTATDSAGRRTACSFKVIVKDYPNVSWWGAQPLELTDSQQLPGFKVAAAGQCLVAFDQSRWYKFKVQPGGRVFVTLTGLPENYDLVLFKDIAAVYSALTTQPNLVELNASFAADAFSPAAFSADAFSPAAFSPAAFSPAAFSADAFSPAAFSPAAFSPAAFSPAAFSPDAFAPAAFSPAAFAPAAFSPAAFAPAAFSPAAFSPAAFSPAAFSPAAFSDAQIRSVIAVSAFDGQANEGLVANTWDNQGDFYVRVRGRNGVYSPGASFQLNVYVLPSACGDLAILPDSSSSVPLTVVPGNYKTLILTDPNRMPATADARNALLAKLATFAGRAEVGGVVVDLALDGPVQFFNRQADAKLDCPYAKNLVAKAIKDVVDRYRAANSNLEYVVLIGGDGVIPFFRYPDQALLGPERNFVPPVRALTASDASLRSNFVLSQDGYGAHCDLPLKNSSLPLPGLAVGRLVESPAEIMALLDAYLELNTDGSPGVVPAPKSALVTGYDFLADVATAVNTEFAAGLSRPVDSLISPATLAPSQCWTADALLQALTGQRHDLIFLAGHFSAVSALAADYQSVVTASDVDATTVDLKNAVVLSAGCHSGYNIVNEDGLPLVLFQTDWPQVFARKQATLVAGTGYQYGDTDFIEYSERLYLEFARQLRTGNGPVSVGKALVRAKQRYLVTTPLLRGIHEKTVLEATLFGLPMLQVNLPGARRTDPATTSVVPTPVTYFTDPGLQLGLASADITVTPTLSENTVPLKNTEDSSTVNALYLSGADGIVNNPAEPVLPLEVRDVTVPNTTLRGVGFRGGTYSDTADVTPLTGAATTEIRGVHATFLTDVFYPVRTWSVNYFDALCDLGGGTTRLVLKPAQFLSGGADSTMGTLRRYQDMQFRLFYSANTTTYGAGADANTPALSGPPSITGVFGASAGRNVHFSAYVTGNPVAGIQEVWVTYTAVNAESTLAGRWQSVNLAQLHPAGDSTLWEGDLTLDNQTQPGDLRFIVQAVNGVGLVALNTRLGAYYVPDSFDGWQDANATPTTATLVNPPTTSPFGTKVTLQASLAGAAGPLLGRSVVFTLGDQQVVARTTNGGLATATLNVLSVPGTYELKVAYPGGFGERPSFASSAFTITQQGSALQLNPPTTASRRDVETGLIATLNDAAGTPIIERTVLFVITQQGALPGADVSLVRSVITDYNGRARLRGVPLPSGTYTVQAFFSAQTTVQLAGQLQTLDLRDPRYGSSTAAAVLVIDADAPVVGSISVDKPVLFEPPNHTLLPVTVRISASDLQGGPVQSYVADVTSNEPLNGTGDGDMAPDWVITPGSLTVQLRCERAGVGVGRTYTIYVATVDTVGNVTMSTVTVFVPH